MSTCQTPVSLPHLNPLFAFVLPFPSSKFTYLHTLLERPAGIPAKPRSLLRPSLVGFEHKLDRRERFATRVTCRGGKDLPLARKACEM